MSKNRLTIIGIIFITLVFLMSIALFPSCAKSTTPAPGTTTMQFEAQKWRPSTWLAAGVIWDDLNFIADYITTGSDGRIVVTPTAPGAICPVEEQVDNVAKGLAECMDMWPGYYPGKVPLSAFEGGDMLPLKYMYQLVDFYEKYQGGKIAQMLRADYANFGDVYWVGSHYWEDPAVITSSKSIPNIDALKGMKFRSSEGIAKALTILGASTVWCPGTEIYTMLATGGVDANTYSHAADALAMGFFEVTKYCVTYPPMMEHATDAFVVNGTLWNKLPADLKKVVQSAVQAASWRGCNAAYVDIANALKAAEDKYGITIQQWSEADAQKYRDTMKQVLEESSTASPQGTEFYNLFNEYTKTIQ